MKSPRKSIIHIDRVERSILTVRGEKVMLDEDLAVLYCVPTHRLNEQVSRNILRFPSDFMFQLTREEAGNLISQNAISSWGGRRKPPRVFTEHGILMLSSVLRSRRAISVNIQIMRTFARLRRMISTDEDLRKKIEALEANYRDHDLQITAVFDALRELMATPEPVEKPRIGFRAPNGD